MYIIIIYVKFIYLLFSLNLGFCFVFLFSLSLSLFLFQAFHRMKQGFQWCCRWFQGKGRPFSQAAISHLKVPNPGTQVCTQRVSDSSLSLPLFKALVPIGPDVFSFFFGLLCVLNCCFSFTNSQVNSWLSQWPFPWVLLLALSRGFHYPITSLIPLPRRVTVAKSYPQKHNHNRVCPKLPARAIACDWRGMSSSSCTVSQHFRCLSPLHDPLKGLRQRRRIRCFPFVSFVVEHCATGQEANCNNTKFKSKATSCAGCHGF